MRKATLIPSLRPYWEKYTADDFPTEPLTIRMHLLSPIAGYNNLNLDGLLARLVVDAATNGNLLDDRFSPYLLPIPLRCIWRDEHTGIPLWASNEFIPESHNKKISVWWHKRLIHPSMATRRKGVTKTAVNPVLGRFKEKRTPMPAQTATVWRADCIGNAKEIARFLENCFRVGKKRRGVVDRWTISKAGKFGFTRPVPLKSISLDIQEILPGDIITRAWSPPYWEGIPEIRGLCINGQKWNKSFCDRASTGDIQIGDSAISAHDKDQPIDEIDWFSSMDHL